MKRRQFIASAAALGATAALPHVHANTKLTLTPTLEKLARAYAAGALPTVGRVTVDIAPLVENGNSVPVEITVQSPMTATDHVVGIALFNDKNPQHDVAVFTLTPALARARVSTRIRLAMSQQLVAVAKMNDGSTFMQPVEVLVTLASCLEEDA
jgi:sulfur-oxidizing protein SoxY